MSAVKPHIITLIADDLGWANVGYHSAEVSTPTIDALVRDGVELGRHYAYRICAPSRISFMTGRLPVHVDLVGPAFTSVIAPGDPERAMPGIPRSMNTLAEELAQAGYANHYVGKWDVGVGSPRQTPLHRGFESFFGYFGHSNDYYSQETVRERDCSGRPMIDLWENNRPAKHLGNRSLYIEDLFTNRSLGIIHKHAIEHAYTSNRKRRLFLVHAFHLVHTPLQLPPNTPSCHRNPSYPRQGARAMDGKQCFMRQRRIVAAMVTHLDSIVHLLVSALRKENLWESTLMLFFSDNGGALGCSGGNNHPLMGGKTTVWEGGVRTVAFLSGGFLPQDVRGSRRDALIHVADWYATFAELAGIGDVNPKADSLAGLPLVDGLNQWPVITGEARFARTEIYMDEHCLYVDRWKYVGTPGTLLDTTRRQSSQVHPPAVYPSDDCNQQLPTLHHACSTGGSGDCLFDIIDDPLELHNLAGSRQRKGQDMALVLESIRGRLTALNRANAFLDWRRNIMQDRNASMGGKQSKAMCASIKRHGGYVAPPSAEERKLDLDLTRGSKPITGRGLLVDRNLSYVAPPSPSAKGRKRDVQFPGRWLAHRKRHQKYS